MDIIQCSECGDIMEVKGSMYIIVSLKCPKCAPESYSEPSEAWPYFRHNFTEAMIFRQSPEIALTALED